MNNTQPENQVPEWFTAAATPIAPQPTPKEPAKRKKLLFMACLLAVILLIGGGVALYVFSVHNAKVDAVSNLRESYMGFYTSFSSIDDITEPEGVDPVDITSRWKAYKDSLSSFENSQLFSDKKDIISAMKSANSQYEPFITTAISYVATYMTTCIFNDEAGPATISDGCFTALQQIEKTADPISVPIAKQLLAALSKVHDAKVMNQSDITSIRDLEKKLYGIPSDFAALTNPHVITLGESVGLNFSE